MPLVVAPIGECGSAGSDPCKSTIKYIIYIEVYFKRNCSKVTRKKRRGYAMLEIENVFRSPVGNPFQQKDEAIFRLHLVLLIGISSILNDILNATNIWRRKYKILERQQRPPK